MNDNFFLDRDGTPLTGKIPLQISLQGDCTELRSQANSELTTFLTDLRLSGLPQMRRTTQLIGGTMEMVHTYGVTQVTLVAVAKEDKLPSDFFGGFYFVPCGKRGVTALTSINRSGKTSSLPGRPVLPGAPDNPNVAAETTRALIIQVHPTKDLKNAPLKNGAVKIFRAPGVGPTYASGGEAPTYSVVSEVPGAKKLPLFALVSTKTAEYTYETALLYGGVSIYRTTTLFNSTGDQISTAPMPPLGHFLVSHGVDKVPISAAANIRRGLLFSISLRGVSYLDISRGLDSQWTTLYVPPVGAVTDTVLPVGTTKTVTTIDGVTTVRLHDTAAGAELSECTITITKVAGEYSPTANVTHRYQDYTYGQTETVATTTHESRTVLPQVVQVDVFKQLVPELETIEPVPGNKYWRWKSVVHGHRLRHVAYKAYGFTLDYSVNRPAYSATYASGTNWITGVAIPTKTVSYGALTQSYSLISSFKGYHYRLRGMYPKFSLTSPAGSATYDLPETSGLNYPVWRTNSELAWQSGGYLGKVDPGSLTTTYLDDPLFAEVELIGASNFAVYNPARYVGDRHHDDGTFRMFDPFTTPEGFYWLPLGADNATTRANEVFAYYTGGALYGTTYEHSLIASGTQATPDSATPTMLPGPVQPDYEAMSYFLASHNNPFDPNSYDSNGNYIPGSYSANFVFSMDTHRVPAMRVRDTPPAISQLYPGSPSNRGTVAVLRSKTAPAPLAYPGHSDQCNYYLHFPPFPFVGQIGDNALNIHGSHNLPGEQLYLSDRLPIAAYPKRAAIFGFTESFSSNAIGSLSITRTGDVVADEHLAEWIPTNVPSFPVLDPISVSVTAAPLTGFTTTVNNTEYSYALFNPRLAVKRTQTISTAAEFTGPPQYDYGTRLPLEFLSVENRRSGAQTDTVAYTASLIKADGTEVLKITEISRTATNSFKSGYVLDDVYTGLPLTGEVAERYGYVGPVEHVRFVGKPLLKVGYWGTDSARNEFPAMTADSLLVSSDTTTTRTSVGGRNGLTTERTGNSGTIYDTRTGTYMFMDASNRAQEYTALTVVSGSDNLKGVFIGNATSCVPLVSILNEWLALGAAPDVLSDVFALGTFYGTINGAQLWNGNLTPTYNGPRLIFGLV